MKKRGSTTEGCVIVLGIAAPVCVIIGSLIYLLTH